MNTLTIIIIAFVGIVLGYWLAKRKQDSAGTASKQSKEKEGNKQKILDFLYNPSNTSGQVTNNDVERLVKVSNATAERYLNELEHDGILTQHGNTGINVFYTLK